MEEQYVEKKKQSIISKSTTEVEFIALVTTNDEVGWLHDFIYEIFTWKKPIPSIFRGDHFQFGSIFIKKSNQTEFFFLKKKTETEPKPGQTDWFRFGSVWFFREKTGSNRFGSVFSGFGSVFFGLARFFRFGSVLARFGSVFFWFFVGFGLVFSVFFL
jgi:hypothetical protein